MLDWGKHVERIKASGRKSRVARAGRTFEVGPKQYLFQPGSGLQATTAHVNRPMLGMGGGDAGGAAAAKAVAAQGIE